MPATSTLSAPTIAEVDDQTGLSIGPLTNGASTDERGPPVTIDISQSGAQAGDTVTLFEDGAVAVQRVLTADDISNGHLLLTPSEVGLGTHTLTAAVTDGGTTGPSSASFSFTVAADPAVSGAPQTTAQISQRGGNVPLFNGAHVDVSNNQNTHVWQMYDSNGLALGARQSLPGPEAGAGLWGVAASPTGGYLFIGQQLTSSGSTLAVADYGADGSQIGATTTLDGQLSFGATMAANGGFLVDYDNGSPLPTPQTHNYTLFNAQAQEVGTIELAGPVSGVTAESNGTFDINWSDGGTARTFVFSPSDTSHAALLASPGLTVIDDQGPQTGTVAAGGTTDDTTPTLRVAVSAVGEIHANLTEGGGAAVGPDVVVQVTSADVARGFVDVTLNANEGDGSYTAEARYVDPSGDASPWTQQNFTLNTTGSGGSSGETVAGHDGGDTVMGGAGNDEITGGTGSNYLRGGAGNDSIQGGSGFNDINGNQGDDTISGHSTVGDWLVGGQGNDVISTTTSNNILYGNLGNDTLSGGTGGDIIRGGQGDDSIVAGSGAEWISGDRGSDTIQAGSGADTFHISSGAGLDEVLGFSAANGDRVQLDQGASYSVTQVGSDTVIDLGNGDEMILKNVALSSLPTTGWIFEA